MRCYIVLVRIDISEERFASVIRVTRIGELVTTLTVTSNRSILRSIPVDDNLQSESSFLTTEPLFHFRTLRNEVSYTVTGMWQFRCSATLSEEDMLNVAISLFCHIPEEDLLMMVCLCVQKDDSGEHH
jgi:hypothetical protein